MATLEVEIVVSTLARLGLSQYESIWYVFPVFIILLILWSIGNFLKSLAKKHSKVQDNNMVVVGVKKITSTKEVKNDKILAKNPNDENVLAKKAVTDEKTEQNKIRSDLKASIDKDITSQLDSVENKFDQTRAQYFTISNTQN